MFFMAKRQRGNAKKIRFASKIIGQPVDCVFLNGELPHNCCIAMTGKRDGFLVNLSKQKCIPYLKDGKFKLKRIVGQYRVYLVPKDEVIKIENPEYIDTTNDCKTTTRVVENQQLNKLGRRSRFDPDMDEDRYHSMLTELGGNAWGDWSDLS